MVRDVRVCDPLKPQDEEALREFRMCLTIVVLPLTCESRAEDCGDPCESQGRGRLVSVSSRLNKSFAKINSTLYVANYDQELKKMRIYCLGLAGRDSSEKASLNLASVCLVERSDV